jgi:AMMECR1 domain-containing protein
VVLEEGRKRSTYLPQVWEDLSNPEEFLESLCQKGGWNADCWKNEEVKLYTYQAEVFGER